MQGRTVVQPAAMPPLQQRKGSQQKKCQEHNRSCEGNPVANPVRFRVKHECDSMASGRKGHSPEDIISPEMISRLVIYRCLPSVLVKDLGKYRHPV